jgi:hypothetical protein
VEVNLHPFLTPTLIGYTLDSGRDGLQELKVVAKTIHFVLTRGVEALTVTCKHDGPILQSQGDGEQKEGCHVV